MIALLQRVSHASVVVDGQTIGAIDAGLMVLVCAERETKLDQITRCADELEALHVPVLGVVYNKSASRRAA